MAKLLVLDDEEYMRGFISQGLTELGHKVEVAENGIIGLGRLIPDFYDMVITDIMMPGMGGFDFLLNVKLFNPKLKFIVMTGYHDRVNIPFCLKYNVSRYLKKPFRLSEIQEVVEEVLAERDSETIDSSDQPLEGWLEMSIQSSEDSLMRLHHYFGQYLQQFLKSKDVDDILQAIYESCQNAMEWGNQFKENLRVKLGCMILGEKVLIKIEDEGGGFDVKKILGTDLVIDTSQKLRKENGLRPGGLGIALTRNIMDDFFYNEKGNCLILTKNLS